MVVPGPPLVSPENQGRRSDPAPPLEGAGEAALSAPWREGGTAATFLLGEAGSGYWLRPGSVARRRTKGRNRGGCHDDLRRLADERGGAAVDGRVWRRRRRAHPHRPRRGPGAGAHLLPADDLLTAL